MLDIGLKFYVVIITHISDLEVKVSDTAFEILS